MIGRLRGRIVDEGPTSRGALLLDVGGVGYEVMAPLGTTGRLGGEAEAVVTLHVHTHVREDALELYGFASLDEREVFRVLLGISNVGPKLALAVLGAVSVNELATSVARGDTGSLTKIPGIGKKTAERLVLELKGKLTPTSAVTPLRAAAPAPAEAKGGNAEVLRATLVRMGWKPAEAERAVGTLAQSRDLEAVPIGELVREALAVLSR
ncbi:MAG: Holliday junction branch migration protein RuvA [Polyangiaceae bacterium]